MARSTSSHRSAKRSTTPRSATRSPCRAAKSKSSRSTTKRHAGASAALFVDRVGEADVGREQLLEQVEAEGLELLGDATLAARVAVPAVLAGIRALDLLGE